MIKKVKILLFFISLSFCLCLMSNTYSRYVAGTTGELEVMFSKWQILVNDTDITNNSESSIMIVPVIDKNENVKEGTIAPSSTGYFDIAIDPTNVDVSFDYLINLELENKDLPDLIITKYALLNNNYKDGDNITYSTINDGNNINGTLNFDNKIKDFKFELFIVRIYFEWYENDDEKMNDEADTLASNSYDNAPFKIKANIKFNQKLK